ncbi:DUF262 domain-containing protein [Acetobacterium fimetarium]|uniref:DUF262 domain-containing protein n=1 Tax=Acetobacterium fimetarium TaxID=52691 RepID=A0ABR6WXW5_9FIRM|nr:DUF262 domain-containing protein [Acetobacterium fimetarium]MBC3805395.1 DUF262 domain-containing protein [Acetobacterium fimetarium]
MGSQLTLKNINELCVGENGVLYDFYIPSYQRGYRWADQVTKLLNDLLEFYNSSPSKDAIYCLQPIIVKCRDSVKKSYEIIDGQQRLTTIWLILEYLFRDDYSRFSLSYERGEANSIDKHHIDLAKESIKEWFIQQQKNNPSVRMTSEIERILTTYVTLIWYELSPEIAPEECRRIFRNINAGKIPLTVSEITKAMLLNEKLYGNAKGEQLYRASVWDEMAHTLENKAFWEFISEDKIFVPTRADYILSLEWCTKNKTNKLPEHTGEIFNYFEGLLIGDIDSSKINAENTFAVLREYFRIFQDWYVDPEYCNYIGYLVRYKARGLEKLIEIINLYKKISHSEFLAWLKNEIKRTVSSFNIEELSFTESKEKQQMQDVLVLFSIVTANKLGKRFDFKPSGGWSLEHIFAQRSEIIKPNERILWLQKYLDSNVIEAARRQTDDVDYRDKLNSLEDEIKAYITENKVVEDTFKLLFSKIGDLIEHYNISNIHSISNLALLGKDDNSSLSNAPFYEKRGKIISMSRLGKNSIPQSTVNVFQKVYSSSNNSSVYRGNLDIWSKQDSEAYFKSIEFELNEFWGAGENNE